MISRIQKVIQLKKLTSSAFADQVGVPRSTISHILSGRNNPSLEFVQKVLDSFPEIRTEWLVRGEGHMLKATNTLFPDEDFDEPAFSAEKKFIDTSDLPEKHKSAEGTTEEKVKPDNESVNQEKKENTEANHWKAAEEHIPASTPMPEEILKSREDNLEAEKEQGIDQRLKYPAEASNAFDKKDKKTRRVLIFYSDGSFSEHFPEQ